MSEMPNTMIDGGGIKNGPGTHVETILFAMQSAYRRGTETEGPYFRQTVLFDIRAGERPQNSYSSMSSGGGARGGPLENLLAGYRSHTPIMDKGADNLPALNGPANEATTNTGATASYGPATNTPVGAYVQSGNNTYGGSSTYANSTLTGSEGPENYMTKQLYGR